MILSNRKYEKYCQQTSLSNRSQLSFQVVVFDKIGTWWSPNIYLEFHSQAKYLRSRSNLIYFVVNLNMYYKNEEDDSRKMFSLPSNLEVLSTSPQQISFRYLEATYKIIFAWILKSFIMKLELFHFLWLICKHKRILNNVRSGNYL